MNIRQVLANLVRHFKPKDKSDTKNTYSVGKIGQWCRQIRLKVFRKRGLIRTNWNTVIGLPLALVVSLPN